MRTYKEVLKYIKEIIVDRFILTEFDNDALEIEWGENAVSDNTISTVYDYSVKFDSIENEIINPICLNLLFTENLNDRKKIEIDIYVESSDPEMEEIKIGDLELILASGKNLKVVREVIKNSTVIPCNEITTVSFDISGILKSSASKFGNINSVGFNFKSDLSVINICRVEALASDYIVTYEEIMKFYEDRGLKIVISELGEPIPEPVDVNLLEATYMYAAGYILLELNSNEFKTSRDYANKILKEASKLVLRYLNKGTLDYNKKNRLYGGSRKIIDWW